jgi:hypothetical protein
LGRRRRGPPSHGRRPLLWRAAASCPAGGEELGRPAGRPPSHGGGPLLCFAAQDLEEGVASRHRGTGEVDARRWRRPGLGVGRRGGDGVGSRGSAWGGQLGFGELGFVFPTGLSVSWAVECRIIGLRLFLRFSVHRTKRTGYFGSRILGTGHELIFSVPVLSVPVPGSFGSVLGSRFFLPRLIRSSPGTHPHTTRKSTHAMKTIPDPNTSFCDHTVTRPIPWTRLFE